MKVGLLRCLLYFPLAPFWQEFFRALGCETVVSPAMTARRFDGERKKYEGDICLPIESAFFHAEALRDQTDVIFVPRVNGLHRDIYVCPACAGLADVLRNVLAMPDILNVNLTPFTEFDRQDRARFKNLGFGRTDIRDAFDAARCSYQRFVAASRSTAALADAIEDFEQGRGPQSADATRGGPRILLLGMPYVLADSFINKGVPDLLRRHGCCIATPFMVSPESIGKEYQFEGYTMYWTLGGMSIAAVLRQVREKAIDGVVYCSSFACGVDGCIVPVVQSICRRVYRLPFLLLVLDEHSENTHIEVRIEAFLDSVSCGWPRGMERARE